MNRFNASETGLRRLRKRHSVLEDQITKSVSKLSGRGGILSKFRSKISKITQNKECDWKHINEELKWEKFINN